MKKSPELKSQYSLDDIKDKNEDILSSNERTNIEEKKLKIGDKILLSSAQGDNTGEKNEEVITRLKGELVALKKENSELKDTIAGFKNENSNIKKENSELKNAIADLKNVINKLNAQINELNEQKETSNKFIKLFMTRLDSIEKYNEVLQKKVDKLEIFLKAYPQYNNYFADTPRHQNISDEKNAKNSNAKNGK